MFNEHLARLNEIAQNPSHENFIEIQKIRADILTAYTAGNLSKCEKRTLYTASSIIMDRMRKTLNERNGDK